MSCENRSLKSSIILENMEEIEKAFKRFDANGDGKISPIELGKVLNATGLEISAKEISQMMAEIDTDGDGFIDIQGFASLYRGGNNGDVNPGGGGVGDDGRMQELKDAFDIFDQDKNGLISATELHVMMKNLGQNCSLHDCFKMISGVDIDGDGHVNFEEFKTMMTNGKA